MVDQAEALKTRMELTNIPGTSLKVSPVAIGTWAIGGWMWGGTDEAESIATIRTAFEHGINIVDTAPVYGFGRSEEIAGKAIAERGIERSLLPYCQYNNIAMLGYGALCRGLLSGRMQANTLFDGDDLRRDDPKFLEPRFAQYLTAVHRLDRLARRRFGKRVIHLAVRWMLDQGITTALWGARHPHQLQPLDEVTGWSLDDSAKAEIDLILRESITDPVGPEFMAPPSRSIAA